MRDTTGLIAFLGIALSLLLYARYVNQLKTGNSNVGNVILLAYPFGKFGELVETVKFTCPCDVDGSKSSIPATK